MVLQWCEACKFSHPSDKVCNKALSMWNVQTPRPKKKIKLEFGAATQTQVNAFFRRKQAARIHPVDMSHPRSGVIDLLDEDNPKELQLPSPSDMPTLKPFTGKPFF